MQSDARRAAEALKSQAPCSSRGGSRNDQAIFSRLQAKDAGAIDWQGCGQRTAARDSAVVTRRIRQLERELARKEKALAEAAALLVLKKTIVQAALGEDDDADEPSGS
jgi:hypothetical protein